MVQRVGWKRVKMKPPWLKTSTGKTLKRNERPTRARGRLSERFKLRNNATNWNQLASNGAKSPNLSVICIVTAILMLAFILAVCDMNSESIKLVSCARVPSQAPLEAGGQDGQTAAAAGAAGSRQRGLESRGNDDDEFGARRDQVAGDTVNRQLESSKTPEASGQFQSPVAYFNLSKMPQVVFGSAYQSEVYLPCQILNLDDDQTVSWIRKRDSLVLTVDKMRLVDDTRFELNQAPDDWTLVLSRPTELDGGLYECQVSSMEPKLSRLIELRMLRAESSISNFSSLFVRANEPINLTCSIEAPQATSYVYWYKNKQVVHFDNLRLRAPTATSTSAASSSKWSATAAATTTTNANHNKGQGTTKSSSGPRDGTGAEKEPPAQWSRSSSALVIRAAQLNDTANYTCLPANAKPSQIRVVVLENGLGSQPEKRSLQADGAGSSLSSIRTPQLTLHKVGVLLFNWWRSWSTHSLGLIGRVEQYCDDLEGCCREINRPTTAPSPTSDWWVLLTEIAIDSNAMLWFVTILISIHVMA